MKKLVILFFLFIGGLCILWSPSSIQAASIGSKSSIYFTETYIYSPPQTSGNLIVDTPTGNTPRVINQELPKTGESISRFIQMGGILVFVSSMILKKIGRRN